MATGTIKQGLTLKTATVTGTTDSELFIGLTNKLPQGSVAVALTSGAGYLCTAGNGQYIRCWTAGTRTFTVVYI